MNICIVERLADYMDLFGREGGGRSLQRPESRDEGEGFHVSGRIAAAKTLPFYPEFESAYSLGAARGITTVPFAITPVNC